MIFKKYINCLIIVVLCLILSGTSISGDNMDNKKIAITSFEDFEWLAGNWEGEAFGGTFEEIWSPATAGSMCGIFKLKTGNKVSFYEIFTITFDSTGPVLNLKHFNPDLTGWEEKDKVVSFPFISCEGNELQFDGLIYRKTSEKTMQIILKTKDTDGNINENIINCKRTDN